MAKRKSPKTVETIRHDDASRKNIPTAEYQSVMTETEQFSIQVAYQHRNRDLDPQLVWSGKDDQDWSDLVVSAPPLYIQEKIHPKVLIDDLMRRSQSNQADREHQPDLFADFNGVASENAKAEFYQHDQNWTNRMILGDSLQVMASLAEREGQRGKVQCIYLDPPYGIKFNSNFQWSTRSRDVQDGKVAHITREPEQVKAFRDTWRDGIHSYLTYLRDRLTVARDLLAESGSIFVQTCDDNVHLIRSVMDEVFGGDNFVLQITYKVTSGFERSVGPRRIEDYIIWFAKNKQTCKFNRIYKEKSLESLDLTLYKHIEEDGIVRTLTGNERRDPKLLRGQGRVFGTIPLHTMGTAKREIRSFQGQHFGLPTNTQWRHTESLFKALVRSERVMKAGNRIRSKLYLNDFPYEEYNTVWLDTGPEMSKLYAVQTSAKVIARCILMTTDPGDLVLDPTCGSGTTAYVSEQWGRRWITIDTSRVALVLARARLMGARYPYYLLKDSREGQLKEAELSHHSPPPIFCSGSIQQGFVYRRVPRITLKAIGDNADIDIIWEEFQQLLDPLRQQLNDILGTTWEEWEVPRITADDWPEAAKQLHKQWRNTKLARIEKINASIAAKADHEYLYDAPYENRQKVRVAGPFTVESTSPHRVLVVGEHDELFDSLPESKVNFDEHQDFAHLILENLKFSGVQQAHKNDKINFTSIIPWPGKLICAEGSYWEGDESTGTVQRAAIFVGSEFGTVTRPDLVNASREAADGGFDVLISCAFNYDAHSTQLDRLGRIPILKARMNADLHMAEDLRNTGKGNLFVIFGEPDIDIIEDDNGKFRIKMNGVDVFHPSTGEVRSDGSEGIACWFVDTDYNEESFFVRHAYFLGAGDPYKAIKTTLKAEIDSDAWASLYSDVSQPFDKPGSGRVAVKVINHLGDEVMKVFNVL